MAKDKIQYRFLVVEDNTGDFVIVQEFLEEQFFNPHIVRAEDFKQTVGILAGDTEFSAVLLDLSLPDKRGRELVTQVLTLSALCCPIIILTGYTDIEFSIESISLGIMDYLLKDDLTGTALYKSITYSIERKKNITELGESQKQYSDLFNLSPEPMCLYETGTFRFIKINNAAIEQYGYSREEFLTMTLLDLVPADDKPKAMEDVAAQKRVLYQTYTGKSRNFKKNGELIEVETSSTPIIINNKESTLVIAIDVTEKNLSEHKITKAIIKTQEDERYEIGGELHDNVCQILAAGQMSLGMLRDTIPTERMPAFTQTKEYIMMALDEIRKLSHRLAPAFFDDSTLEEAFNKLFSNFNIAGKIKSSVNFDVKVNDLCLSLEMQLNLYRILQEQLRNILKYAKASFIEVKVFTDHNGVKMTITDNGIGFNLNRVKDGIGLANMKRRAELFSGRLDIQTAPGNGCKILVEMPV